MCSIVFFSVTVLTFWAKVKVFLVSERCSRSWWIFTNMSVFASPYRCSLSIRVSLDSRYGTWASPFPRDSITFMRQLRDAFILIVSFLFIPVAWLFFRRSEPAKSIRLRAPSIVVPSLLWPFIDIWNTKCDREEFLFIAVLADDLYRRAILNISYRFPTVCTSTFLLFIVDILLESSLIPSWSRS